MTHLPDSDSEVVFDSIATATGHQLGLMTLNDPKALNALSLTMCELISAQLARWQQDDSYVAVVLQGAGDKALCAGGNIRKLYDSMVAMPAAPNPDAVAFFGQEYHLHRQMYHYPKPIIVWVNGIVMGGGLGITAMSSHRIVTETTRFAMPEITIGLYPDAAGSWFLPRMPAKVGLFMGLTGAQGNAADALLCNLAEYAVGSHEYARVLDALCQADWRAADSRLHDIASRALASIHHTEHLADSHILAHWLAIQRIVNLGNIHDIDAYLRSEEFAKIHKDDAWMMRALDTYQHGSPTSAALTFETFRRGSQLSLEDVQAMEMNVSVHCTDSQRFPDFREGVRALIIDKDKNPRWQKTLADITQADIAPYFETIFIDKAPL